MYAIFLRPNQPLTTEDWIICDAWNWLVLSLLRTHYWRHQMRSSVAVIPVEVDSVGIEVSVAFVGLINAKLASVSV